MTDTLVDANVLIDVWSGRSDWASWSIDAISAARRDGELVVNSIIFAEVSVPFDKPEEVEAAMPASLFRRDGLPWEAAFLAGKAFVQYRKSGGNRGAPLPDFYIGAHALVKGYRLLTRDARRYRTYFDGIDLITPDTRP